MRGHAGHHPDLLVAHVRPAAVPDRAPLGGSARRVPRPDAGSTRVGPPVVASGPVHGGRHLPDHAVRGSPRGEPVRRARAAKNRDQGTDRREGCPHAAHHDHLALAVRHRRRLSVFARQRHGRVQGGERLRRAGGVPRLERHREPADERVHAHLQRGAVSRRRRPDWRRRGKGDEPRRVHDEVEGLPQPGDQHSEQRGDVRDRRELDALRARGRDAGHFRHHRLRHAVAAGPGDAAPGRGPDTRPQPEPPPLRDADESLGLLRRVHAHGVRRGSDATNPDVCRASREHPGCVQRVRRADHVAALPGRSGRREGGAGGQVVPPARKADRGRGVEGS